MPAHRQDAKADAMYALYQRGHSLAQVARAFAVSRQSVYKMFAQRGLKLRTIQPLPFIVWQGHKYTRRSHGYYACTTNKRRYLHRDVWESLHGPIPSGYDVHHRDENKTNNAPANLELLLRSEHGKRHGFGGNQFTGSLGRRPVRSHAHTN